MPDYPVPVARNEGVPGSSPGVGFGAFAGLSLARQRAKPSPGYLRGTFDDPFTIHDRVGDAPHLGPFCRELVGRLLRKSHRCNWPRFPVRSLA
jgi:hypothetical protein